MQTRRNFISTIIAGAFALPSVVVIASRSADLEPVDWLWVPPGSESDLDKWDLRHCDLCGESAIDDITDRKIERQFYRSRSEQLIVCEHCLPGYLVEPTHA